MLSLCLLTDGRIVTAGTFGARASLRPCRLVHPRYAYSLAMAVPAAQDGGAGCDGRH